MRGIISALIVPFNENQEVEYDKLRKLVDYNINVSKVDGLYVNGSTGENFTIDTKTKKEIFKVVKEQVNSRVDLIAQIGSINIKEAIELGKYVSEIGGYRAISAITPFYYKFSYEEIKNYYEKIIKEVDMDMIIYSIPGLTGVGMTQENFSELLQNEKIIGVKFTSNDFYTLERLKSSFPSKLIYSGFDEMLLSAAVVGIDGAIGSTYNYQGFLAKKVLENVEKGDIKKARQNQKLMNETIEKILKAGLYQTIKAVVTEDGCDAGDCNLPFSQINEHQKDVAKEILKLIK